MQQIFIRFYKLTLQIISRLAVWTHACVSVNEFDQDQDRIEFYVLLHSDIVEMAKKLVDYENIIIRLGPKEVQVHVDTLAQSFSEACDLLTEKVGKIEDRIVDEILKKSAGNIKQVNDIPRLYRKTNREIPSKPCAYVDQMLDPSRQFMQHYSNDISPETCQEICRKLFSTLNMQ